MLQEGVNWALYIGIVMVLCAFLISLLAPNVRHLVKFAARHRLGEHARYVVYSVCSSGSMLGMWFIVFVVRGAC